MQMKEEERFTNESSGQWRSEDREQKEAWGMQMKLPGVNEPGSYEQVHQ